MIRPFATVGFGWSALVIPHVADATHVTVQVGGEYNYGAGVKFRLGPWGVRFDVRNHLAGNEFSNVVNNLHGRVALPSRLDNLEYTATVSWLF